MTYLKQIYSSRPTIWTEVNRIAIDCMHEAHRRAGTPQEPDFVAMLTMIGAPELNTLLDAVLHGSGVSSTTTGVFCHQSPKVKFVVGGVEQRCELGDLLLAHIHSKRGVVQNHNALLLQAKMAPDADKVGCVPDAHQLALYRDWPSFEYYRSGSVLNTQTRSVFPHQAHPGAQYLLIDPSTYFDPKRHLRPPSGHYPCAVWMPEPVLYPFQSLSEAVFGLLAHSSGRVFGSRGNSHFGWTRVIWDLLETSLTKAFNRRNIGVVNHPRVAGPGPTELPLYCTYSRSGVGQSSVEAILKTEIVGNLSMDGSGLPPGSFSDLPPNDEEGYASVLLIETYEE